MKPIESRYENIKLKRLLDTAAVLNSSLDIEHLLPLVMISARDLLEAEASSLFLLDKKHNHLYCEVAIGEKGKTLKQYLRLEMGEGIAGWVAENKKPLLLEDAYQDQRFDQSWDKVSGFKTKSIICIPIFMKDHFLGTLEVMNKKDGKNFEVTDMEILEYMGNIAAIALENARLHEGLQVKIRELSLLTEMEKKISEGWTADQLIDWVLFRAMEVLRAKGGSAFLFSEERRDLYLRSSVGFMKAQLKTDAVSSEKGVIGVSLKEKRPVLVKNIHADKRFQGEPVQLHESSTMLCAPLQFQGELLGVFILNDKLDEYAFTRDDLNALNNVAERLSILLGIAQTFNKMKETSREQESAAKLMEQILPTSIPKIEGLNIYARYLPYNLIGGDFYRFFEFGKNKLGILMVDVSGHGFSAALISVMVNTMISTIPMDIMDAPSLFFRHLNNSLLDRLNGNFLTGNYMVIDMNKKRASFANAGHTDLVHFQKDQRQILPLNCPGPLLGIWKDPLLEEKEIEILPGDRIVIYTDGLMEIIGRKDGNSLNDAEMLLELKKHIELPPLVFTDRVIQTVLQKSIKNEFNDDVTMITLDFQ